MKFLFLLLFTLIHFRAFAINAYEPVAIDSRIKTFIYSENEIYNLKFRIGYNSIIEFSKDEAIETISLGDPYPWKLTPLDRRLFMKPIEPGVKTNMTVITNKRVYLFEIESDISSSIDSIDVVHVARFFYPVTTIDKLDNLGSTKSSSRVQDILDQKKMVDTGGAVNVMYSFAGKANVSTPIEIFDDKRRTYMRFKTDPNYRLLKIFSVQNKAQKAVQFKRTGDFIILEGVFKRLVIEYEGSKTEVYNDLLSAL